MVERLQTEVSVTKQEKVDIIKESFKKILGRLPNWKSPGPHPLQGFWLKNFSILHGRVRSQHKQCLDSDFLLSWLTNRLPYCKKTKAKVTSQVIVDL